MGVTDPNKAQEEEDSSIRSIWGGDLPYNIVHGSGSVDVVAEEAEILGLKPTPGPEF